MSTETEVPLLKGEGEVRITKEIRRRHGCEECGEPATHKHTYLLVDARRNPQSKGYRKDDLTWCEDDARYACEEHMVLVRRQPHERGTAMEWCATFDAAKLYPHMLLYWQKVPA